MTEADENFESEEDGNLEKSPCLTASHGFPLLTLQTQSPLRVQATVMIFSKFLSSSDSKVPSAHVFPLLTHQTQSPLRVDISVMIFSKFPSSSDSKFSSTHVFPLLTHQTQSPVRVEASIMILLTFRLRFLISRSWSGTLISFLLVSSVGNGLVLKSSQGQSLHHDLS